MSNTTFKGSMTAAAQAAAAASNAANGFVRIGSPGIIASLVGASGSPGPTMHTNATLGDFLERIKDFDRSLPMPSGGYSFQIDLEESVQARIKEENERKLAYVQKMSAVKFSKDDDGKIVFESDDDAVHYKLSTPSDGGQK